MSSDIETTAELNSNEDLDDVTQKAMSQDVEAAGVSDAAGDELCDVKNESACDSEIGKATSSERGMTVEGDGEKAVDTEEASPQTSEVGDEEVNAQTEDGEFCDIEEVKVELDSNEDPNLAEPSTEVEGGQQVVPSQVQPSFSDVMSTETEVASSQAEKAAPTTPNISSYFGQTSEGDAFGTITSDIVKDAVSDEPVVANVKLQLPTKDDTLKLQEEDEERLYSPPVSKDEMSNDDLLSVHEVSVDLSKASQAEVNRMYDAWIPSDSTRMFLVQALASGSKFHLPTDKVLKPRLAMADTQADPVYQETFKLRGEQETQRRQVLNLSKVEHTMAGLQQLTRAECWRSGLDLTAILLTNMGQGLQPANMAAESVITEQSMKVWAVRVALLTKLRLYSIAEAECQQFSHMDSPELHFEYHYKQYPGRTGSMVPFSLRLMYANLPQFLGRHNESLDRLFYIRGQVNKILHNLQNGVCEDGGATVISEASLTASTTLWHQRELQVQYSLGVCFTDMKDFRLAISIYKEILARDPDNACFTYSTMARLCLQMGALKAAESNFNKSLEVCTDEKLKQRLAALHSGFLNICAGEYSQAPAMFGQASSFEKPSAMAKNNSAVSMLYNGQLKAGVLLLEELIHSDPVRYLQDTVVTNLCTLYELESSVALAKKQSLLFLANRHKGNGFNVNCLKIV